METSGRRVKSKKPKIEKWLPYAIVVVAAFMTADLVIIRYRHLMLPDQAPPPRPKKIEQDNTLSRSQLTSITTRNIFASNGIIPDPLRDESSPNRQEDAAPVLSNLPLTLIGTLVHSNPAKSIAAIEMKGKNQILSFSPGKEIDKLAKIEKIERLKVVFRNLNNNLLEYIEMAQPQNKVNFESAPKAAVSTGPADVVNAGNNTFKIKRADLLKYTNDLSSVLMQARAVPNKDPITGEVNGFRLLDMQPGSIYERLGLQRMDVIKTVNGEPVDSIQKAMELYNALKNNSIVKMGVERGGKQENMTYNID